MNQPSARISRRQIVASVVLIIAIGIVLLTIFPPHLGAGAQTRAMLHDLQLALKNYGIEYDAWPDSQRPDAQFVVARGSLLRNLLGKKTKANPRAIAFAEFAQATKGTGGLRNDNNNEPHLVDEWGGDVFVGFDAGNSMLAWPPRMKKTPQTVPDSIAIFSCGPDGIPGNEDDVTNWRR